MKYAELWKGIVRHGLNTFKSDDDRYHNEHVQKVIQSPIIVGPSVSAAEKRKVNWRDFTGMALPFNRFWFERRTAEPGSFGCLVESEPVNGLDGHHYLHITQVVAPEDKPPFAFAKSRCILTDTGDMMHDNDKLVYTLGIHRLVAKKHTMENGMVNAMLGMALLMDALMILSATNVSLASRRMNDAEATREATRRNGGHPAGYRYHVLVVRPTGSRSDAPAQELGIMPQHLCRGHFAEYGPKYGKGLLFGKYEGRFYIPPHVKGDAKNGFVHKDYRIPA